MHTTAVHQQYHQQQKQKQQQQQLHRTSDRNSNSNNSKHYVYSISSLAVLFFPPSTKKAVVVIIVLTGIFSSSFVQISILRPSLSGARVRVSRNCMCSNVMQSKAMSTTDERCLLYKYHTLLLLVDTRTVKISNTE